MQPIPETQKFITIPELKDLGYSYYKIGKLEKAGNIRKVNRSTYENLLYTGDENDFFTAEAFVPDGVICLLSAARYYELTEAMPHVINVAIQRDKKVSTMPDWPELKIYYFDDTRMDIGVETVKDGPNTFHIFSMEKTVVDIVYYRNKVGIEETQEILKRYLERSDRNIDVLYEFSKKLRCERILRTYLEVLL